MSFIVLGYGVIALKITSENLCVLAEVAEGPRTQTLLSELKNACQGESNHKSYCEPHVHEGSGIIV